jgi:hypothetical protein
MSEKIRDPMMELFMEIDGRIENAIEMIRKEEDIPEIDYKMLFTDKESLLEIFKARIGDPKEVQYEKIWANNLINKIDLIFETNNKKL